MAMQALAPDPDGKYPMNTGMNPSDLDKPILLKGKYTVPAFTSVIVHRQTKKTFMLGQHLNMMVQAPYVEDLANLPLGLYVQ